MCLPPHHYQELRERLGHWLETNQHHLILSQQRLGHRLGKNQHHQVLSQHFPRLLTRHYLAHLMQTGYCPLLQGPQHLQDQSFLETVQRYIQCW